MLAYMICAAMLGVLTEALAYALGLWWYRKAWLRIPNVLVVFGVVYGGMAWGLAGQGWLIQFVVGALVGVVYEVANDRWLKFWHFPGDPWTWLKGQPAVLGVGLAWGFVPLVLTGLMAVFT